MTNFKRDLGGEYEICDRLPEGKPELQVWEPVLDGPSTLNDIMDDLILERRRFKITGWEHKLICKGDDPNV